MVDGVALDSYSIHLWMSGLTWSSFPMPIWHKEKVHVRCGCDLLAKKHLDPSVMPPKMNKCPKKGTISKGNFIFQPLSFRGYVSFFGE